MHLEVAPVERELVESDPLVVVELAAAELELGRKDTAGVVLGRAGQVRCRADLDLEASVLAGNQELRKVNIPSAEEDRWQAPDIGLRVELAGPDIAHTAARSSDSEALELGTDQVVLGTADLVEVGHTSEGSLADRAGFVEGIQRSADKLFVDTAVAVKENFVVAAVLDWEPEKLVEPGPMPARWESGLCTAAQEPVEIDWEAETLVALVPIPTS